MLRTHTCGEITKSNLSQEVTVCGWVNTTRDHGGVIFIDLRDRYGMIQIKTDPETVSEKLMQAAKESKSEFVLQIKGKVVERPDGTINSDLDTGEIEIIPDEINILAKAEHPPFEVADEHYVREENRMEYRYIDLRRKTMKNNIIARNKLYTEIINYYSSKGFLYIETPELIKNTPEGAREYIVPSRHYPGKAYVLPQSPQQIKQLLMVSGMDRYFQMAKCFRDEDLRGDRQPEFTQVDVEMSFIEQDDIIEYHNDLFLHLSKTIYPEKQIMLEPFPKYTYVDSMNMFGIDKPELRTLDLQLIDVSDVVKKSDFQVFANTVKDGGCVKGIVANKVFTRGEIDKFTAKLQEKGAKGMAYIIWDEEGPKSPILKFFSDELQQELYNKLGARAGTTTFFQATNWLNTCEYLGYLRTLLIENMELMKGKENELYYAWVIDFPMFEINEEGQLSAMHHPFTKPKEENIPLILELAKKLESGNKLDNNDIKQLLDIKADAYDITLNGYEIGGGSIRITDPVLQKAIFTIFGLNEEQIQDRFGHMLKAFKYGVPPHGGLALGFDRLVMIYQNMPNIREVIPFPKTQKGEDLLLNSPSEIDPKIMKEIGLKVVE